MRLPMHAWNRKDNLAKFAGLAHWEEFELAKTKPINKGDIMLKPAIQNGFYLYLNAQGRNTKNIIGIGAYEISS